MPPDADARSTGRREDTAGGPGLAEPNAHARSRRAGPYTVIEASGEIDVASAAFLAEHLTAAVGGDGRPDVLVDLRPVVFLDCSALRVLCRAEATARARGGRLRLVSDRPRVHRLLRAARLLGRFPPLPELPLAPPPHQRRGPGEGL